MNAHNSTIEADPRWAAIIARDKDADGRFVYSVRTTGVYCRPSCAAKRAKPENVRFHANAAEAESQGFRACKRCRPNLQSPLPGAEAIAEACRTIENAEEPPSLVMLAKQAGVSPHHFHRRFKAATGLTPRAYAASVRARRVQDNLRSAETVTEAIYEAGFNASSRFYEQSHATLGMKPRAFRHGGARETIRFALGRASLGHVLVAATDKGVCALFLGDDPDALLRDLQDRFSRANLVGADEDFEQLVARVVALVEGRAGDPLLPLDIRGTAFQHRVWDALRAIPLGATATYAEIAERIGAPGSVRAVANACGANPVAVAIPCHRVVRTDGAPGGYRWGMARKERLLARERESQG